MGTTQQELWPATPFVYALTYDAHDAHYTRRCRVKAADWLKKKNKPKAMMELKRKQRLQSVLDKRLSFIENIHQILHTIEQTQTDKEVPSTLKHFFLPRPSPTKAVYRVVSCRAIR